MTADATDVILVLLQEQSAAISDLRRDVQKVQNTLAEKQGERRAAVWMTGVVASVLGSALTLLTRAVLAGFHP